MLVLCEVGAASAPELHARVGEPRSLAYTTTATVLNRLHAKGLVTREKVGKTFLYRANMKRERLERARVKQALVQLLGPEPLAPMATLVDAVESMAPELLDELARLVAARRRSRRGS